MKLGISSMKIITYQLRWFVLIMEVETSSWYVDMFYVLNILNWTAMRFIILNRDIRCSNLQSGSQPSWLCITTNIL